MFYYFKYYTIMLLHCLDQYSIVLYYLVGVISFILKVQIHMVHLNTFHFQIQQLIWINSQVFLY